MTGYGRAEMTRGERLITVEIKSLNGKQLELYLKIPAALKAFEFDIRSLLQQQLQRGTLDFTVTLNQHGTAKPVIINNELARQYYLSISALAKDLHLPETDLLSALIRLPEVISPAAEQLSEKQWLEVREVILAAVTDLDKHRLDEGAMLEGDLLLRLDNIEAYREKIIIQDPLRREKMRLRLDSLLNGQQIKEKTDTGRLEQELVFYVERMDIAEELSRLANHCRYFRDVLQEPDPAKGKKLGFVLQEIGREINTTGSKANDAAIQQWVVMMKDELEKAREQVLNVL